MILPILISNSLCIIYENYYYLLFNLVANKLKIK